MSNMFGPIGMLPLPTTRFKASAGDKWPPWIEWLNVLHNSIALAMELLQSCTKPLKFDTCITCGFANNFAYQCYKCVEMFMLDRSQGLSKKLLSLFKHSVLLYLFSSELTYSLFHIWGGDYWHQFIFGSGNGITMNRQHRGVKLPWMSRSHIEIQWGFRKYRG